jgi:Ca2+/H+ antiporter, TMEM165/GDT1 family
VTGDASVLAAAYVTVLAAELVGDRSLCAIGAMAARFRPLPVLLGVAAAFMGKMLVAVLLGSAVARVAGPALSLVSALSFLASAALLWWRREEDHAPPAVAAGWAATPVAFSSVFFTEWADVGQLTAAALAAQHQAPAAVWVGATAALSTKGALAVTLGVGLRRVVPAHVLRHAAVALCLLMAAVSLAGD